MITLYLISNTALNKKCVNALLPLNFIHLIYTITLMIMLPLFIK